MVTTAGSAYGAPIPNTNPSIWWLCADEKYQADIVSFSGSSDDPNAVTIPAVMIQTGSARTALYPGIYRAPRVRTYSDKFGTPTTITDAKEISFSAIVYGDSMDDIYGKWQQINSYFDRAEIAASPFPRGSGVILIEQINDAEQATWWDVKSGVITDVDFNIPQENIFAAVIQLTVLPFSRGRPNVIPFGSTVTNGTGSSFYLPYSGGDAPGLFELRLSDQSAPGHYITWVGIGRRWYPQMAASDFTPWYPENYNITTSNVWKQILQQASAPGAHQTGMFGVYAVVNDASPIIGQPANLATVADAFGTLSDGFVTAVIAPKDVNGNLGQNSSRLVTTISNPNQPGDVQFYEGFEENNWYQWFGQPTFVYASSAAHTSLTIDATNPIVGLLSAHFKSTGDTSSNSITSSSASILPPGVSALGLQSIAFQIRPISWGTFAASSGGTTGGVIANPVAAPSVTQTGPSGGSSGIAAPNTPTLSYSSTPAPPGYPFTGGGTAPLANPGPPTAIGTSGIAAPAGYPSGGAWGWYMVYSWTNSNGETLPSVVFSIPAAGLLPEFQLPAVPAGATGVNVYAELSTGALPSSALVLWTSVPNPHTGQGIVVTQTIATGQRPALSNTTGTTGLTYYWNVAYTWITPNGETTPSGIAYINANGYEPSVAIPAFPAGVTGARIYIVLAPTNSVVYANMTLSLTVGAPGNYAVYNETTTTPPTTNTTGTSGSGAFLPGTYYFGYTYTNASGETTISPLASLTFASVGGATVAVPSFSTNATSARIYVTSGNGASGTSVTLFTAVGGPGTQAVGQGNGITYPPGSNTTQAATAPSTTGTARFMWGSVAIVATSTPNYFAVQINGVQIGSSFLLGLNTTHQFGINYQQALSSTAVAYSVIVDNVIIGSSTGSLGSGFTVPTTATWTSYGVGAASPLTEEWYLDEIYVYDELLQPGFNTLGTGLTYTWINGVNTTTTDFYFSIQVTGETTAQTWYVLHNVLSPFRLPTPLPAGATLVEGPPSGIPVIANAQLQTYIGVGNNPVRWVPKSVVRTVIANGNDELVRLGSLELPPGSKAEYRDLDGWSLQIWGKTGGTNFNTLTVKGIILFPEDEDGWAGITAKAYGLNVPGAIWHIGTNRWGRPYAQIFANDGVTLVGYADTTGAIGSMGGDNNFVVLTGRDDGSGHLVMDLTQQFQLGCQNVARYHFEVTESQIT